MLDKLRHSLRALSPRSGRMQSAGFLERVSKHSGLSRLEIRQGMIDLEKAGEIEVDLQNGEPMGRILLKLLDVALTKNEICWMRALKGETEADAAALRPLYAAVGNWRPEDQSTLISGLNRLREEQDELHGLPAYVISARYLLGSSKLLTALPKRALLNYGIAEHVFFSTPPYLVMAGSAHPEIVILVENPHAFEMGVAVTEDMPITWAATFGYGLSMASEQYGDQLASNIAGGHIRSLVSSGNPPEPHKALACERLAFWGDLDPEGMRIYNRLRSSLPTLHLSALYEPMLELLNSNGGHPLHKAVAKDGQKSHPNHPLGDICESRGLDQEVISARETIRKYAMHILSL